MSPHLGPHRALTTLAWGCYPKNQIQPSRTSVSIQAHFALRCREQRFHHRGQVPHSRTERTGACPLGPRAGLVLWTHNNSETKSRLPHNPLLSLFSAGHQDALELLSVFRVEASANIHSLTSAIMPTTVDITLPEPIVFSLLCDSRDSGSLQPYCDNHGLQGIYYGLRSYRESILQCPSGPNQLPRTHH